MIFLKKIKQPAIGDKTHTQTTNPYLNARRAWNGHVASIMQASQIWQVIGIISLLITLVAVGGLFNVASKSKYIPLVFQEDKAGNLISMTRADEVPLAKIDDFRTAVAHFIENTRTVTVDIALERKLIFDAFAYLNAKDPATKKMNEYFNAEGMHPFERAQIETVSVDIRSVLQQSKTSWQVDWVETVRDRDGGQKMQPYLMRALVTIYQAKPSNESTDVEVLKNPHFIFIKDFNWSKQISNNKE